jgi:nucleoside-diphosphate-sugar epimerase
MNLQPNHTMPSLLPQTFRSEEELDAWLTRPRPELARFIRTLSSPLVILGAGGKMGPTLSVLARRAADEAGHPLDVIAVSRFGNETARRWLEQRGVHTLSLDLLEPGDVQQLPDAENVLYLVGLKFGTTQNPALTWAVNTLVPAQVMARYPQARIVALSTGNVYPLSPVAAGGSLETDPLTPLGEYANAAVARERLFEFCAQRSGARIALLRLFYAVELRYGVVADLARRILDGTPVPLATGAVNCIWQGDANELILRSLALAGPTPSAWNLCRPESFPVRDLANRLGIELGCAPQFEGREGPTALLGNAGRLCQELGDPPTSIEVILRWVAHWVKHGGRSLGKPTHFEVRDGQY